MRHLSFAIALALAGASPAAAEWREARTDHFVIYSEQDEAVLRDFAAKLERYDGAMRSVRRVKDVPPGPATRLTIYVVDGEKAVQRLYGDESGWVAGFYSARASGSIAVTPQRSGHGGKWDMNAENVLLHEYAHHFLYQNYVGAFPAWFIEGFAEFHAAVKFEEDGSIGIGMQALHRAHSLMGKPTDIEVLLASPAWLLVAADLYGYAWQLTHYLLFEPERDGQLVKYLSLINQGSTSVEAATAAFGSLRKLSADLFNYRKRKSLTYARIPPQPAGPLAMRALGRGENALMELKIRSRVGVTAKKAVKLADEIRALASSFADDPAVQATLAEAEYDSKNYADAVAAADRALAADPKYLDALIYKAMAAMALAEKAADPLEWQRVRRLISAANRQDPDHAAPLILFYKSFEAQGIAPTPNSVLGLNRAFELAPHDRQLRLQVGRQYLRDGKVKEARDTLAPATFDPHAGEVGKFVTKILAQIDSGGAPAALKTWEEILAAEKAAEDKKKKGKDEGGGKNL